MLSKLSRAVLPCLGVALLLGAAPANADPGLKVGVLSCEVEGSWGFIVGSSRDMDCHYRPFSGEGSRYVGTISKFGVDIGYISGSTIMWDVFAPYTNTAPGALSGGYVGASAGVTVGAGVGVNALVGGLNSSIALQPVSLEGNTGFDLALGVGTINLHYAH